MQAPLVFDAEHYERLNNSRGAVVRDVLSQLKGQLGLRTAIDVGCGLGYFSDLLHSLDLQVVAVDARQDNVKEAQRRYPQVRFQQCNAEDPGLRQIGRFDLVFCFGFLYHLENPLLTVRHLHAMTAQLLLVEGVVFPGEEPIMALVDEGPTDDQGLNHFAFYPTEACLKKMLYRSGFRYVYRFTKFPEHPDFHEAAGWRRVRTMLAASHAPVQSSFLKPVRESRTAIRPCDGTSGVAGWDSVNRLLRFARKPLPRKVETLKRLIKGQ